MIRRALSYRVVPGRWAEIDAKIVFNAAACPTANCSESVNSFRQNGFCVRFFRPWLSFGGVKSQNEFVTKPLSCNKGSVHQVEISKFVLQKSLFRWGSKCILGAEKRSETTTWASEKHQTFPIFDLYMTRRALSCRVIPVPGCWAEIDAKIVFRRAGFYTSFLFER